MPDLYSLRKDEDALRLEDGRWVRVAAPGWAFLAGLAVAAFGLGAALGLAIAAALHGPTLLALLIGALR